MTDINAHVYNDLAEGVRHFVAGPLSNKVFDYFVILKKVIPNIDLEMQDLNDIIIIKS